jgi:SAM-dependent methyltransferase
MTTDVRDDAAGYWDAVAAAWPRGRPPLWRRHGDAVNGMLLERWLPATRLERVLKTDLFDELASAGLYPILRPRAGRIVGIDVSPRVVRAARARYPELEALVADVRRLPFEDRSFDAVISDSTLDHFRGREEVAAALGELWRVLRPDGRLLLTLDNRLNPLIALRNVLPPRLARALRRVPYDVGWTCGPRLLRRLLAEAGFEVRELTAILHVPRVLVAEAGRVTRSSSGASGVPHWLLAAEQLGKLPTRYLTGHYVAALATPSQQRHARP